MVSELNTKKQWSFSQQFFLFVTSTHIALSSFVRRNARGWFSLAIISIIAAMVCSLEQQYTIAMFFTTFSLWMIIETLLVRANCMYSIIALHIFRVFCVLFCAEQFCLLFRRAMSNYAMVKTFFNYLHITFSQQAWILLLFDKLLGIYLLDTSLLFELIAAGKKIVRNEWNVFTNSELRLLSNSWTVFWCSGVVIAIYHINEHTFLKSFIYFVVVGLVSLAMAPILVPKWPRSTIEKRISILCINQSRLPNRISKLKKKYCSNWAVDSSSASSYKMLMELINKFMRRGGVGSVLDNHLSIIQRMISRSVIQIAAHPPARGIYECVDVLGFAIGLSCVPIDLSNQSQHFCNHIDRLHSSIRRLYSKNPIWYSIHFGLLCGAALIYEKYCDGKDNKVLDLLENFFTSGTASQVSSYSRYALTTLYNRLENNYDKVQIILQKKYIPPLGQNFCCNIDELYQYMFDLVS